MDDVVRIGGYTMDEALSLCCDEFCKYPLILHTEDDLDAICSSCPLTRVICFAYEDQR